jgi:hypothetical protein
MKANFLDHSMAVMLAFAGLLASVPTRAQEPSYLRDRGTGVSTSMFGTYIRKGEVIVYPFLEYYRDMDAEYTPQELGFGQDVDFRGEFHATEALLLVAYGVTDNLAVELEAAFIDASLKTALDDASGVPAEISESGLGDVEAQLRYRIWNETEERPELFAYAETVFPLQKDKLIIGTSDWEHKVGAGMIKGFSFGTLTLRASIEYTGEEGKAELGEYAIEYLRRLSPRWRVYAGIEGVQDEVELITEAQLWLREGVYLKLNNAFGVTSKATDWAPEVGILFSF